MVFVRLVSTKKTGFNIRVDHAIGWALTISIIPLLQRFATNVHIYTDTSTYFQSLFRHVWHPTLSYTFDTPFALFAYSLVTSSFIRPPVPIFSNVAPPLIDNDYQNLALDGFITAASRQSLGYQQDVRSLYDCNYQVHSMPWKQLPATHVFHRRIFSTNLLSFVLWLWIYHLFEYLYKCIWTIFHQDLVYLFPTLYVCLKKPSRGHLC